MSLKALVEQKIIQVLSEESDEYTKAWEKHRAEIKSLADHGFGHSSSGNREPDGKVRSSVVKIVIAPNKRDEHYFYIGHSHDNMTRKNSNVKTKHTVVRDGVYSSADFDPGPARTLDQADHTDIESAIKYTLARIENVKKS